MRHICLTLCTIVLGSLCIRPTAASSPADILKAILAPGNLIKYKFELLGLVAVALYIAASLIGTKKNQQIAHTWLRALGAPDGVLTRNFVVYGGIATGASSGQELWWKDSASSYKCYASGRRYCSGALLTISLKARQDIFTQLWYLVSPTEDTLQLDVFMNESAMPQTVMVLGQPKLVKALLRDEPDVAKFAKLMQLSKDRVPGGWSNERVAAAAEHPSLLYELLNTEPALAKGLSLKWLRSAVLNSEVAPSASPACPRLSFVFALPPPEQADELNTLLSCAFLLVDLLGSYKVSPEMKKKAVELRQKLQQEEAKKGSQDRLELLQQKRMEKLEAERAKARAAGPAALAKFEEKMQAKMRQKEMRKRTIRG